MHTQNMNLLIQICQLMRFYVIHTTQHANTCAVMNTHAHIAPTETMWNIIHVDDGIKTMKELLNIEKSINYSTNRSLLQKNIPIAQNLFDQSIKLRKQSCITSYIDLLNKEEKKLMEQFNLTLTNYETSITIWKSLKLNSLCSRTT